MSIHCLPSLAQSPRHHVYALLCQDESGPGYVKFGMSMNIGNRLTQLRSCCPIPVRYIAICEVGPSRDKTLRLEKALHLAFANRRVKNRGEWFRFDFANPEDKKCFNETCRHVFQTHFGVTDKWWSQVSVEALDEAEKARRANLMSTKKGRQIIAYGKYRARQRKSWRELY